MIFLIILNICSCEKNIDDLPDELSIKDNLESPYYLKYNPKFSYSSGNDNNNSVKQGQRSELFSNIRIYNEYLYVYSPSYTVCRYNPETGNVVAVCQKPNCFHNSKSCPFAGMEASEFYILNNSIYFTALKSLRLEGGDGYGYYLYNMEEDTISRSKAKRSESTIRLNGVFVDSDGNQYYYDPQYDEKTYKYFYNLCKYSPSNELTEVLQTFQENDIIPMFIDKIKGRLYYLDGIGIGIYHEDTNEREEIYSGYAIDVSHDNEFFYFLDYNSQLYRIPIDDGSAAEKLTDFSVCYYYLTDNYIYYKIEESVIVGSYENGDDADIESQKIYRMRKDGSEKELVWEFNNELSLMNCNYFIVDGNYLYAFFFYWDDMGQIFIDSTKDIDGKSYIIRIDLNAKEYYFIDLMP